MAKKKTEYDNGHLCDDCKFAEWHTQQWNLDLEGKPLTYSCAKCVFEHGEVRGKKACRLWQIKTKIK